ncbi:hypothetical protein U1Q18_037052, partial [Sarracenia purpurea var. burkii]
MDLIEANKQRQRTRRSCKSAQARRPAASASAGGDFSPELFFWDGGSAKFFLDHRTGSELEKQ